MNQTPETNTHVQHLVEDLEDKNISPERLEELYTLLRTSPEARRIYCDHMSFAALLQHEALNLDAQDKLLPLPGTNQRKRRKAMVRAFSMAAAAIVALAVIAHFILLPKQSAYASYTLSQGAACTVTHASPSEDHPESSITAGSTVNLKSGELTVKIPGATTLFVKAPASLHFKTLHEIELLNGDLWASSSSKQGQLSILSGGYIIEDIGTKFGVLQSPNKPLEVHLIEGKVKITYKSSEVITLDQPSAISLPKPDNTNHITLNYGPFTHTPEVINIDFAPHGSTHGVRSEKPYWNHLLTGREWNQRHWGIQPNSDDPSSSTPLKNSKGKACKIGVILVGGDETRSLNAYSLDDPARKFGDALLDDYLYMQVRYKNQTDITSSVILTGLNEDTTYTLQVFSSSKSYKLDDKLDHHDTEFRVHHKDGTIEQSNEVDERKPIIFDKLKPFKHEKYGTVITFDWGWLSNSIDINRDYTILNGLILTEN